MRIYLSAVFESAISQDKLKEIINDAYVLHSFAYFNENYSELYSLCKDVMLDSGAFTVMNSVKSRSNFNPMEYCRKYANHIKKYDIKHFIELDIEGVYGFDVYKDCLHQLQDITGRDPIYVFHKWRGLNYFDELVKKYDYIALGDVSVGKGSREIYKYFPYFLNKAHQNNCKVHGLAFTSISDLRYMQFDSVDSSSWKSGDRFAHPFRFDGHNVNQYNCKCNDERKLDKGNIVQEHDFLEWKKLAIYFDKEYEPIW